QFHLFSTDLNAFLSRQYMVLVPSSLHTETPEKSCLLLRCLNETVTVSASLESTKGKRSLFNDLIADKDLFHCVSFTLPRSSSFEDELFFSVQIKGPTHEFSKRTTVLVKNTESLVFIQTDKQIYTPGQSVKFRIVSVDKNFHPLHELFPLVHIEDPGMNRIMQWQNIQLENGLKQLSFSLSSEPIKGSYKIVILKQSGIKTEHSFTVEEFGGSLLLGKPLVTGNFSCDRYTYGKPVPGHVTMSICRKYHYSFYRFGRNLEVPCEEVSQKLDSHGCIMQQVKTSVFQLKEQNFQTMKLQVNAKITEEGTGVGSSPRDILELTGTGTIEVTRTLTKLTFVKVDSHFRRGIPFFGQVCLVDGKGVPIPDELISIQANEANYSSNATTDEHGLVQFSIDTTNVTDSSLTVSVYHKEQSPCFSYYYCMTEKHKQAYHTANHVFSLSKSYVYLEAVAGPLPCGQIHTIQAHYILNGQVLGELKELVFYYLIMAKGSIIRTGVHILPLEPGKRELRGCFSMSVPVESDIAPIAQLLLYAILPDGEVFGDFAKYEVENCLPNKVDLSFHPTRSLPASHAHLRVTASPQSLCALRAVDQSVLLMKPEAELSPASVSSQQPRGSQRDFADFIHSSNQQKEDQKDCYMVLILWDRHRICGSSLTKTSVCNCIHTCHILWKYLSQNSVFFSSIAIFIVALPFVEYNEVIENFRVQPFTETVRNYFPETWIWDLVVVNSSGVAEVGATVPDTITEWKAGALCLSSGAGLGLSPTASLQAFQPFFLELTMPYSVIRGEAFTLKATVLNYLPKCIRLEASLDFMAIPVEKDQDSYCLCSNGRQTVSWLVTPKSLGNVNFSVSAETLQSSELCGNEVAVVPEIGRKDTVVKLLLVEPEGIKKEYAFNSLLCASVVLTSHLSFPGDILGSAIKNTQNLLQMPYGCGEQNMVLFAPNIYVLKYLNETHQLTQEIKSKAIGYLNAGYQRQLNYKHRDGSYSAFGDQHGKKKGNTWLTAFVLKSLAQARAFIFIDETHITQALTWLSNKQKNDGCFKSSGSLLNNAIKGGVEDEVTLSTYITIALLEIPLPVTVAQHHPVCPHACGPESAWKTTQEEAHGSHVYTKALLAYAFALAGDQDKRREILKSLEEEAIKEHNATHWERPQKPKASVEHLYETQAPSAEVEMTSYVLLAYLTAQPTPTSEDLTSATHIVKWITKQQNSQGGFSSTQDTVVALHALSIYGAATFAGTGEAALVTIQSSGTFSTKFQVENTNRLLLQQVSLPDIPGEYSINVSGEGCVYIQALKYNVFLEKKESAFALQVQTIPQICDELKVHTSFQVSLEVSYTGSRPVSNMVIADVKMISGFIPLKPTVKMLELSSHVSRTEVSNNHVLIYVEQVTSQTLSFSFTVVQDIPVRDLKPAIVKVYDYYETGEKLERENHCPSDQRPKKVKFELEDKG
uniref:Alpha-2-macroglobulin n=1 Tax=Equus asinus TaxID=9793 RepID=A0A8C4PQX4_EQUAS